MSIADGSPTDSMLTNLKEGTPLMYIYQPFFYVIQEKSTGKYYAGSRYGNCADPELLLKEGGYFTSSKLILNLIEQNGIDSFTIRKIRKFESAERAYDYETKFLRRVNAKDNPNFYNGHNNGWGCFDPSKYRKTITKDGFTSYQLGAKKAAKTKSESIVGGKNTHQRAYEKAIQKNPNLHELRAERMATAMGKENPVTGMNKWQEIGLLMSGDNNPSRKPENARKISLGRKRYITQNKDVWASRQSNLNTKLSAEKDEDGLTVRDKHSLWMKEHNPTKGSKWYNDGKTNVRLRVDERIPEGFFPGKIKRKS